VTAKARLVSFECTLGELIWLARIPCRQFTSCPNWR